MGQRLTTSDKRPAERMEFWQEEVCRKYVAATAVTDLACEDFSASLTSRELGALTVAELSAPLHYWSRKPSHVRNDAQEVFIVSLIRRGGGELSQRGRSVRLAPGDLAIYDSAAPFDYALAADTHLLKIPKALLQARLGDARDLVACRIGRGDPLAHAFDALVGEALAQDFPDDAARRLSCAMVDLLAAMFDVKRAAAPSLAQTRPLEKAMAYARARLDEDLTPERLAEAGGVSVRTLNRLFGLQGATPMRWLWAQRLEASRAALEQGQAASVTEAAFSHGFRELAHFSRSFKKAFGVSPQAMLRR